MKKTETNEPTNILQLNFGDLNNDEKKRYLEFLVSNQIDFQKEMNNNFVATIKIKKNQDNVPNQDCKKIEKDKSKKSLKTNNQSDKFESAFVLARTSSKGSSNQLKDLKNLDLPKSKKKKEMGIIHFSRCTILKQYALK